jgi:hypothetical protein
MLAAVCFSKHGPLKQVTIVILSYYIIWVVVDYLLNFYGQFDLSKKSV